MTENICIVRIFHCFKENSIKTTIIASKVTYRHGIRCDISVTCYKSRMFKSVFFISHCCASQNSLTPFTLIN